MRREDMLAFLFSLGITALMIWGLVYFIQEWWARLPKGVALIICILLSVMVIGYPIYAMARWSDRYLARLRENQKKAN
jgi:predicted transporter